MIVDLADLKLHLRVDGDDEDFIIAAYGQAADARVSSWIGRPIYAVVSDMPAVGQAGYDTYQMVADQAIRVAIMKMVALMYGPERDGSGNSMDDAVPPRDIRDLLSGYRVFHRTTDLVVP